MRDRSWTLLSFFLLLFLPACGYDDASNGEGGPDEESPTPAVAAVQARYGSLPLEARLSGTVRATGQVAIYPEISAPVVEVLVDDGDQVERGQPLVRLKSNRFRDQLEQARANLRIAEAEAKGAQANLEELQAQYRRTQQLAEQEYQSEQELEVQAAQVSAAEANYEQAQANVEQAQSAVAISQEALNETVVRAPISGTVGAREAEVGMQVSSSTHLFTIGDLQNLQVNVSLTEAMLANIEEGQTAVISSNSLPDTTTMEGEVARISPFLDPSTYTTRAEIAIENERGLLRPGMFVAVDILYGESQNATLVPTSALYEDPTSGIRGVYVAPSLNLEVDPMLPSSTEENAPMVGPTPIDFVEVEVLAEGRMSAGISGIEDGTWVVVVGQNLLQNASEENLEANVRPMAWDRIVEMQSLQRQDLLQQFLDEQQRMARQMGADTTRASAAAPHQRPQRAAVPPLG